MNKNSKHILICSLVAIIALAIGGFIGWRAKRVSFHRLGIAPLEDVFRLIDNEYVDTVDIAELSSALIPNLLQKLDPHSEYIPREESILETQRLEGAFYGVGITFNTIIDTPVVINVIKDGPAYRAGILAGDRLLTANEISLLSDSLTADKVKQMLQGEKGSIVSIDILRDGVRKKVDVNRDEVTIESVDVCYMLDSITGLLRINSWGRNTHAEVLEAIGRLKKEGLRQLVIDLRDNVGGYLQAAALVANEFLPENSLIVYSKGEHQPLQEYRADGTGLFQEMPLAILVNELSASASEIFSGCMQDHDRATILGRRTFGKGLVQRPFYLKDSAQIRLTVARYYIPSGRSIQKKYTLGQKEDYNKDLIERFDDGQMYHIDTSLFKNAPRYTTENGRTVYGESGIMPDVFVAADSTGQNAYYLRLLESNLLPEFAFRFADTHRATLRKCTSPDAMKAAIATTENIADRFADFAASRGIPMRSGMLREAAPLLNRILMAQIAQFFLGTQGFYQIYFNQDPTIDAAIKELHKAEKNDRLANPS